MMVHVDLPQGRRLCYAAVYSLDATRCIILHLAATQSLVHASGRALGLWTAGAVVVAAEACLSQVHQARFWYLSEICNHSRMSALGAVWCLRYVGCSSCAPGEGMTAS